MLQLSGEKMSKSIGNLITIEDFLAAHPADALRMMVLNSGYRNPLTFNDEVIGQAERALERLQSGLKAAQPQAAGLKNVAVLDEAAEAARSGFEASMDDDFNSAGALGHLFELVRVINQARADGATDEQLKPAQDVLEKLTGVLGLTLRTDKESQAADAFVDLLVDIRQDVRQAKLWELSDKIRDKLSELGVQVEDAKGGSTWFWK
jgi:cysteinyl-tRNA synthetase